MVEKSGDCLILCHHNQDRKVSAKSVTMRAMTLFKKIKSGYRELLLIYVTSVCIRLAFSLNARTFTRPKQLISSSPNYK